MEAEIEEVEAVEVTAAEVFDVVVINPLDYGVAVEKALPIENAFIELATERNELQIEYKQMMAQAKTPTSCAQAKELSRRIGKNRNKVIKIHKAEKEVYLRAGQLVDAFKNRDVTACTIMEDDLDEFGSYLEKIEQQRIAQVAIERDEELRQYTEVVPVGLGMMLDEVYAFYLTGAKKAFDDKNELARIAEEERVATELAHAAELERLRKLDIKEKAEAKAAKLELEKELAAQKLINEANEAKAEKERKAQAKALKDQKDTADALLEKERLRNAESARVAKEKNDKLLAEQKEIRDAAQKIVNDELAKKAKEAAIAAEALKAPDKTKLTEWVNNLTLGTITLSNNAKSKTVGNEIFLMVKELKALAKLKIETI